MNRQKFKIPNSFGVLAQKLKHFSTLRSFYMGNIFTVGNVKKVFKMTQKIDWRWEKSKKLNSFRDIHERKKKRFFAKKCILSKKS